MKPLSLLQKLPSGVHTLLAEARNSAWVPFALYVILLPPAVALIALILSPLDPLAAKVVSQPEQALSDVGKALLSTSVTMLTVAVSVLALILNLTSQQISPRALGEQLRRPLFRHGVGFLFGAFASGAMITSGSFAALLPNSPNALLVVIAMALLLGAVWAFVGVIQNAASNLQVNRMLARLHERSCGAVDLYFDNLAPLEGRAKADGFDFDGEALHARRAGYLQAVQWKRLIEWAEKHDAKVRLCTVEGDFVGASIPALKVQAQRLSGEDWDTLRKCVAIASDREPAGHPYRALSILSDIALKGLSPALNDPTTAKCAVDYLEDLLHRIFQSADTKAVLLDERGAARISRKPVEARTAFDCAFRQIAYFARGNAGFESYLLAALERLADSDICEEARAAARWFAEERILSRDRPPSAQTQE